MRKIVNKYQVLKSYDKKEWVALSVPLSRKDAADFIRTHKKIEKMYPMGKFFKIEKIVDNGGI